MLAALLLNLDSGASSHDGWLRHHHRERARKKEHARLAAELKELYVKIGRSIEAEKILEAFTENDKIKWLTLAQDVVAIERFLAAIDAQRGLLLRQQTQFDEIEAEQVLHMASDHDRELVRQSLIAIAKVLH